MTPFLYFQWLDMAGEILFSPTASQAHSSVAGSLSGLLISSCESPRLGENDQIGNRVVSLVSEMSGPVCYFCGCRHTQDLRGIREA
jgi:hypothetical protein